MKAIWLDEKDKTIQCKSEVKTVIVIDKEGEVIIASLKRKDKWVIDLISRGSYFTITEASQLSKAIELLIKEIKIIDK